MLNVKFVHTPLNLYHLNLRETYSSLRYFTGLLFATL